VVAQQFPQPHDESATESEMIRDNSKQQQLIQDLGEKNSVILNKQSGCCCSLSVVYVCVLRCSYEKKIHIPSETAFLETVKHQTALTRFSSLDRIFFDFSSS
jgi:hypothetical protein